MAMTDLPMFGVLKQKMHWLSARQQVLAENVSQADVPEYRAQDLKRPDFAALVRDEASPLAMKRSSSKHLNTSGAMGGFEPEREKANSWETSPDGNSVVLEQEMMKVSETVSEYRLAANLYTKSMGLLKTAIGK